MAVKKQFETKLFSDKDGLRFATPEPVARYRSKRLKCRTIADISCGIGGQTIYFAKECEFVYAVEIDAKKIEYAKKNCELLGIDNVKFICGDALSPEVISQIPEVDIVFSDPARPPEEESRHVSSLRPGIPNVMEAYKEKTLNFAFEAPPQLSPERVDFDCEKEYISLNGKLNRLTLYFGKIKRFNRVAVSLPAGEGIVSKDTGEPLRDPSQTEIIKLYAYEPEPSAVAAKLLPELVDSMIVSSDGMNFEVFNIDKKRTLITSDFLYKHPLIKNTYIVLKLCDFDTFEINKYLKSMNTGKVILRAGVDPSEYWNIRNELENGLEGSRTIHLFVKDSKAIICEVILE